MREPDMGAKIMEERLSWAIAMVKKLCTDENLPFNDQMFIKAIEAGISLYIQKERRPSSG